MIVMKLIQCMERNTDVMKPFNSHIKRVRKLINKVEEGKKIADSELEGLAH